MEPVIRNAAGASGLDINDAVTVDHEPVGGGTRNQEPVSYQQAVLAGEADDVNLISMENDPVEILDVRCALMVNGDATEVCPSDPLIIKYVAIGVILTAEAGIVNELGLMNLL